MWRAIILNELCYYSGYSGRGLNSEINNGANFNYYLYSSKWHPTISSCVLSSSMHAHVVGVGDGGDLIGIHGIKNADCGDVNASDGGMRFIFRIVLFI